MFSAKLLYTIVLVLGSRCRLLLARNETDPRYIEYLDYDTNLMRVIDLLGTPDPSVLNRAGTKDANTYLLFTRENPSRPQKLIFNNSVSIQDSSFNRVDQTIVIVHGWKGDRESPLNKAIKDAFLGTMHANVIVVDWGKVASSNYITATKAVVGVGETLGHFLEFLNREASASYNTMHLVGFSLGAHVVGSAGRYLSGQVARITGLDPAGPLWNLNPNRLQYSDAVYVEAIHTDRAMLGTFGRSGDADFYPNAGTLQPGCSWIHSCSHSRSWKLFAATISLDHLVGRRCDSEDALDLDMCFGERLHMGNDDLLKKGSGMYRLKTDAHYPYPQID